MELVMKNDFSELNFEEMVLVEGGSDAWHFVGEVVGSIAGIAWDIAVVARALYTGSWV